MKLVTDLIAAATLLSFNTLNGSYRDEARRAQRLTQRKIAAFNTLNGSYRDEAWSAPTSRPSRPPLSIPSTGRTGMKPWRPAWPDLPPPLSIPSTGRTGMKQRARDSLSARVETFNTLNGSYRDEAVETIAYDRHPPDTFNTLNGSYRDEARGQSIYHWPLIVNFQYPQRVVPG